jgi:putative MATE family efflux protein
MDRLFNQAFVMSCLVGIVFFILAFALRGVYARALAADGATAEQGIRYLRWFLPAMLLQFGMVALGSALRGVGDMKNPTLIQISTVLLNIALAPVLIAGWGTGVALGVDGAGLATLIAVTFGTAAFVLYFGRPASPVRFRPRTWRPDFGLWRQMLGIGLPSGGEFLLIAVYIAIVYDLIAGFGAAAQAGFGIGGRLMQALFLPAVAISFATAPVAGQNFGAGHADRVRETFYTSATLAGGVMLLTTLACQIAPATLIGMFSADPAVIAFGEEYLRIVSWNFVASGIIFAGSSVMQGMGNTRPALLASAFRLALFTAPAYVLVQQPTFEMRHVWYLSTSSVFIHMVVLIALVRWQFRVRLKA